MGFSRIDRVSNGTIVLVEDPSSQMALVERQNFHDHVATSVQILGTRTQVPSRCRLSFGLFCSSRAGTCLDTSHSPPPGR